MSAIVETATASIDTLSVTVRALHVNSKQMTLAVFRQLPQTQLYNDDGTLVPLKHWGIVRYAIRDEADLWVVAEGSDILWRCALIGDNLNHWDRVVENDQKILDEYLDWEAGTPPSVPNPMRPRFRGMRYHGERHHFDAELAHSKTKRKYHRNLRDSNTMLGELPQLFIAL